MRALFAFLTIELLLIGVFAFGDIGFDHPGRFGLDFEHAIGLGLVFGCVLVAGLVSATAKKMWYAVVIQLALPICAFFLIGGNGTYLWGRLDPAALQFLVGQTEADVIQAIGDRRPIVTGAVGDENGSREFKTYHGATIYYSSHGRVLSVEPE